MSGQNRQCRVVVFIDGQNVYEDFRRAFAPIPPRSTDGQFRPAALAGLLANRGPYFEDWQLAETRIYVGKPVAEHDPRSAAAHDRQVASWEASGVTVRGRPLLYPREWPTQKARQKGVDVELALDVATMAFDRHYEVGIIVSTDTDLVPVVELVHRIRGTDPTPRICVIRFEGLEKQIRHPDVAVRLFAFKLTKQDYLTVHDPTVYAGRSSG